MLENDWDKSIAARMYPTPSRACFWGNLTISISLAPSGGVVDLRGATSVWSEILTLYVLEDFKVRCKLNEWMFFFVPMKWGVEKRRCVLPAHQLNSDKGSLQTPKPGQGKGQFCLRSGNWKPCLKSKHLAKKLSGILLDAFLLKFYQFFCLKQKNLYWLKFNALLLKI